MRYSSWGGRTAEPEHILTPTSCDLAVTPSGPYLAYGNGRSYDTSCLPARGTLIDTRGMKALLAFNPQTGLLKAEAGMMLADVLTLAIPHGWFLAVTPGTRLVTLGGALANDVHGKNHHRRGTFGTHVQAFEIVRSDATRQICSRDSNGDLFRATIGGMGLTGLVTWIEIQLMRVPSSWLRQQTIPFESLNAYATLDRESETDFEYTVAWIDGHARNAALGRGLFMRANHTQSDEPPKPDHGAWLKVPFTPPVNLVRDVLITPFNKLYRRRAMVDLLKPVDYRPFFYPLDGLANWNRLYGPRGFRQFQCVVPCEDGIEALNELVTMTHRHKHPSSLVVLKRFGSFGAEGLLSFARPGYSIAMDFADMGRKTRDLFAGMQAHIISAGGALNPYKDADMSPAYFQKSFPEWQEFARHIDPAAASLFSEKMALEHIHSTATAAIDKSVADAAR